MMPKASVEFLHPWLGLWLSDPCWIPHPSGRLEPHPSPRGALAKLAPTGLALLALTRPLSK